MLTDGVSPVRYYLLMRRCILVPNIASAKKRVRVTKTKTLRNKMIKSNLKTAIKNASKAVEDGADNREQAVIAAIKKVDQAASKGVFHKNKAANKKSQLQKMLNNSGK